MGRGAPARAHARSLGRRARRARTDQRPSPDTARSSARPPTRGDGTAPGRGRAERPLERVPWSASLQARHGARLESNALCTRPSPGAVRRERGPPGPPWRAVAAVARAAWTTTPWSQADTRERFIAALGTPRIRHLNALRDADTADDLPPLRVAPSAQLGILVIHGIAAEYSVPDTQVEAIVAAPLPPPTE